MVLLKALNALDTIISHGILDSDTQLFAELDAGILADFFSDLLADVPACRGRHSQAELGAHNAGPEDALLLKNGQASSCIGMDARADRSRAPHPCQYRKMPGH